MSAVSTETATPKSVRIHLPDERESITHKFDIAGYEGYITASAYRDGRLGEIFISMAKQGSVISGLMDAYGVPLEVLVNKFRHTRFEPSGVTRNPEIPMAMSLMDYIFRWLELRFLDDRAEEAQTATETGSPGSQAFSQESDAPPCSSCGAVMVRSGPCYRCLNCGLTSECS
jgi:ribonucleoside-diphosphate reductase alpha chain